MVVLECPKAHLFRLPLRAHCIEDFTKIFTVNCMLKPRFSIYPERMYKCSWPHLGYFDAPSVTRIYGGPVVDAPGQAVGMILKRGGQGLFANTEGLIYVLAEIKPKREWRGLGDIKAVVCESFLAKEIFQRGQCEPSQLEPSKGIY